MSFGENNTHAMPLEGAWTALEAAGAAAGLRMDSEAFAAFYDRTAGPLWGYVRRTSGTAALADDVTQESFVRFLCASTPAGGEVEARRYLFRIATNLLRDHWRRPVTGSLEDLSPESLTAAPDGHEASLLLDPAMARLKPRERQMLWLAHAEGYSHREGAEVMGLATASVKLLLFRARRKLAAALGEERL